MCSNEIYTFFFAGMSTQVWMRACPPALVYFAECRHETSELIVCRGDLSPGKTAAFAKYFRGFHFKKYAVLQNWYMWDVNIYIYT